ncbi:replication initiator protein A [Clostridium tarantellae]|uniref:Uncharacterized protein n=1 Tax=Clostridium tarantellae TaxID=39493 RepID=A0A6I1MJP2_9CLOT|nr:replication initiator protein A [Clostridium tarantellae]MPQ43164.1 hypothetical protein [Clostridium tarantellae]
MSKNKINESKDLMVEINLSEAPMFTFARTQKIHTVKSLMENKNTTNEAKEVLEDIYKTNELSKVDYRKWIDSKGMTRELIISSVRSLPDSYCMDVFLGLIRLMVNDNSPLCPDENGLYKLKSNKVEFTLNRLCEAMELKSGGNTYKKIKDALRRLKATDYYSLGKGSLYNKVKGTYETRSEKAVSLIDSYDTSEIVTSEDGDNKLFSGYVTFGDLIMNNLEAGFVRVVRNHQYFQLKTGITRGLYLYIESNRTSTDIYIKRSFDVLKNKIPIDFEYPSRLKSKLKKSLESMYELGIIKDWFYGDEILINGFKEQCIYIIFKGTRKELIQFLTKKEQNFKIDNRKKTNDNNIENIEIKFPEDINKELLNFGINEKKIIELINKHSKYELAEYILWMQDGISKGKVKDPASLFVFATTTVGENGRMVNVEKTHPHIIQFVKKYKEEVEGKKSIAENIIKKAYEKYIDNDLKLFEEEDEFAYVATRDSVLEDISNSQKNKIKSQRAMYNMATSQQEKLKLLAIIEKWERFTVEQYKSEIFLEEFVKRIKIYRGLMNYLEFRSSYIKKNK